MDAFGNKELLYRDPDIGCLNPIPLRSTRLPEAPVPALKPTAIRDKGEETLTVANVYETRMAWPAGTKIQSQ